MKRKELNNITDAVKSDISQLSVEITEPAIDSILSDGLLKDVPVVGTIAKIVSMGQNVKNWFFTKKVYKFLLELEGIDLAKRQKFVDELEERGDREEVGEALIVILDRLDHLNKANLIGKIFQSFILEIITLDEFLILSAVIDRIFIADLNAFLSEVEISDIIKERLYNLGIYSMDIITTPGTSMKVYSINELGKQLKEILG